MAKAASSASGYSTSGATGTAARKTTGFLNPVTAVRDMKCITVSESELHNLSVLSGLTTLFFGLATTCCGIAIGIYTSFVNDAPGQVSPAAQLLHNTGEPAFFCGGGIFFFASIVSIFFSRSTLRLIKGEMRK